MIKQVITCDAVGCGKEIDPAKAGPTISVSGGNGTFHSCGPACRAKVFEQLRDAALEADKEATERLKKLNAEAEALLTKA